MRKDEWLELVREWEKKIDVDASALKWVKRENQNTGDDESGVLVVGGNRWGSPVVPVLYYLSYATCGAMA